jgi:hypothetical protein
LSIRFKNYFVVSALVFSIGLQWPLLQSVAWVNMLVSYCKKDGLEQAVVKTFDGNHPCKICKIVDEGKKAEKKHSDQKSVKKFDLISSVPVGFLFAIESFVSYAPVEASILLISYKPLSPPPDLA